MPLIVCLISVFSCNGNLRIIKVCFVDYLVFVSLVFANRWYAFEGVFLYPKLLCPWTGYFGATSRLAFPLFYMFQWRFFRCPFCFRRPRARNLVLIFTRTKSLQIVFSGAIGKGKSLALQARTPRPTWFPRESLTPLLKMLFSEIPVVLWLGN